MVFQDRTYAVLIVSSSEAFSASVRPLLPGTDYWPVDTASFGGAARRNLLDRDYDLILINAPLKDEFGSQLAMDICSDSSSLVLLFVRNELLDEVTAKVMEYGVMTIQKPVSSVLIAQSLRMLCAQRERLRRLEEKQKSVEEKIRELRAVNRAKWLLIEQRGMTEEEAHRYVEKQAMDQRLSKLEMATVIIEELG